MGEKTAASFTSTLITTTSNTTTTKNKNDNNHHDNQNTNTSNNNNKDNKKSIPTRKSFGDRQDAPNLEILNSMSRCSSLQRKERKSLISPKSNISDASLGSFVLDNPYQDIYDEYYNISTTTVNPLTSAPVVATDSASVSTKARTGNKTSNTSLYLEHVHNSILQALQWQQQQQQQQQQQNNQSYHQYNLQQLQSQHHAPNNNGFSVPKVKHAGIIAETGSHNSLGAASFSSEATPKKIQKDMTSKSATRKSMGIDSAIRKKPGLSRESSTPEKYINAIRSAAFSDNINNYKPISGHKSSYRSTGFAEKEKYSYSTVNGIQVHENHIDNTLLGDSENDYEKVDENGFLIINEDVLDRSKSQQIQQQRKQQFQQQVHKLRTKSTHQRPNLTYLCRENSVDGIAGSDASVMSSRTSSSHINSEVDQTRMKHKRSKSSALDSIEVSKITEQLARSPGRSPSARRVISNLLKDHIPLANSKLAMSRGVFPTANTAATTTTTAATTAGQSTTTTTTTSISINLLGDPDHHEWTAPSHLGTPNPQKQQHEEALGSALPVLSNSGLKSRLQNVYTGRNLQHSTSFKAEVKEPESMCADFSTADTVDDIRLLAAEFHRGDVKLKSNGESPRRMGKSAMQKLQLKSKSWSFLPDLPNATQRNSNATQRNSKATTPWFIKADSKFENCMDPSRLNSSNPTMNSISPLARSKLCTSDYSLSSMLSPSKPPCSNPPCADIGFLLDIDIETEDVTDPVPVPAIDMEIDSRTAGSTRIHSSLSHDFIDSPAARKSTPSSMYSTQRRDSWTAITRPTEALEQKELSRHRSQRRKQRQQQQKQLRQQKQRGSYRRTSENSNATEDERPTQAPPSLQPLQGLRDVSRKNQEPVSPKRLFSLRRSSSVDRAKIQQEKQNHNTSGKSKKQELLAHTGASNASQRKLNVETLTLATGPPSARGKTSPRLIVKVPSSTSISTTAERVEIPSTLMKLPKSDNSSSSNTLIVSEERQISNPPSTTYVPDSGDASSGKPFARRKKSERAERGSFSGASIASSSPIPESRKGKLIQLILTTLKLKNK